MAAQVSVDHAAYNAANNRYGDVVPAIRQTAQSLSSSVDAASGGWQGQAYTAFVSFHQRLNDSIGKLNVALQQMSDTLAQGHKTYTAADQDSAHPLTTLA